MTECLDLTQQAPSWGNSMLAPGHRPAPAGQHTNKIMEMGLELGLGLDVEQGSEILGQTNRGHE